MGEEGGLHFILEWTHLPEKCVCYQALQLDSDYMVCT